MCLLAQGHLLNPNVIFLLPLVVKSWITLETIHWLDSYHHYMVNTEHRLNLFYGFSHLCDSHQFCKQSKMGLLDQTVKSWQEKLKTCFLQVQLTFRFCWSCLAISHRYVIFFSRVNHFLFSFSHLSVCKWSPGSVLKLEIMCIERLVILHHGNALAHSKPA